MQTRSGYKAISHSVLLNDLILENIFSFLELRQYLPLRLVCGKWNTMIQKEISKDKKANFSDEPNQRMIGNITETAHYFSLLKITMVKVGSCKIGAPLMLAVVNKEDSTYKIFLETMNKSGAQVKRLHYTYNVFAEKDLVEMKKILSYMPNLEYLEVQLFSAAESFWNVFKDFSHPKLKSLRFQIYYPGEVSEEEFISSVLKCFPNLETNFGQTDLDLKLLEMLSSKKVQIKLTSFATDFIIEDKFANGLSVLSQFSPQVHQLSKLELLNIPKCNWGNTKTVFCILHNFASTLKTVAISCDDDHKKEVVLRLPPLPQLRTLRLGMKFYCPDEMYFTFYLGKRMAKDYPLLEYLTFKPEFVYFSYHKKHKAYWTFCKPWKAFVPFEVDGNKKADLSPFKFLKFVDLNIPLEWTEHEENRQWCQEFVDAFAKIYANVGNGSVQHVIDWLI